MRTLNAVERESNTERGWNAFGKRGIFTKVGERRFSKRLSPHTVRERFRTFFFSSFENAASVFDASSYCLESEDSIILIGFFSGWGFGSFASIFCFEKMRNAREGANVRIEQSVL